jgi:hypothetical protein
MTCPSCKSDRCGNHAACARRLETNTQRVLREVKSLGAEIERDRGKPLSLDEWQKLTEDFMRFLGEALEKEKATP